FICNICPSVPCPGAPYFASAAFMFRPRIRTPMAKSPGTKNASAENTAPPPASASEPAAPKNGYQLTDASAFGRNMARVAAQSQQLLSEFVKRQAERFGQEPMDPLNLAGAYFTLLKHMAADPGHMFTAQIALWRDYLNLLQRTGERALGRPVEPFAVPASGDRRFRDKDWQENQIFDFIKQSYLVTSNW